MKAVWFALLVLGATATLAGPTAADTTTVPYHCDEHLVAVTDAGTAWVDDGVLHVRDWTAVFHVVGDRECAGTLNAVVDFNLDLTSYAGSMRSTAVTDLEAFDGGYLMKMTAQWTATDPLAPDAHDIWAGRYEGHGFGALEGWQTRGTLVETTHQLTVDDGYAFLPGT